MKRLIATLAAAMGIATVAYAANTAKAVVLDGGKTWRFVYDDKNYGSQNTDWFDVGDLVGTPRLPLVSAVRMTVERVEFTHSFRAYKPTSCNNWFFNFTQLKTVAGTCNLDVSQATNLAAMFGHCEALTHLDLSTWSTARVTDFRSMFNGCSSLTTIYATDSFTTTAIAEGNGTDMFYGCTSLVGGAGLTYAESRTHAGYAQIDSVRAGGGRKYGYFTQGGIPIAVLSSDGTTLTFYCDIFTANHAAEGTVYPLYGWNSDTPPWQQAAAQGVFSVVFDPSFALFRPHSCREWFANLVFCNSVSGLQYLHTEESSSFARMFYNCFSIPAIDMSGFDTSSATDMREMFAGCTSMIALNLSSFDTSKVTDMGAMFTNCNSMAALDISGFDTLKVTDMSHMFNGCSNLTGLDVSGFDTANVTNMSHMFRNCATLTSLDVSCFDTSNVTDMKDMFRFCDNLSAVDLSNFNTSNVTDMNSMFSGCVRLADLDLSSFDTSKVTDMCAMFRDCKYLTSLDLSSFDTSNVTNMEGMFAACYRLESLDLSNFDTSKVTDMSYMFNGTGLRSLNLSSFDTSKVTDMGDMFSECNLLKSLDLYNFDTSNVTYMQRMFYFCCQLTCLNVSSFNTAKVENMRDMFRSCTSLPSMDLGNFDMVNVRSMFSMFENCYSMEWINLSGFNPERMNADYIDALYLFLGCSRLKSIYVSSDYSNLSGNLHGLSLFFGCDELVGGAGTMVAGAGFSASDAYKLNWQYARIDIPPVLPGYFTAWFPPVAVYSAEAKTLTFYFDGKVHLSEGTVYSVADAEAQSPNYAGGMPWSAACSNTVTNVIFDASFAKYRPKHCGQWFRGFTKLEGITGIENLDVSGAGSLRGMFYNCASLRLLDLSGFNTPLVRDMSYMFYGCTNLASIVASENFTTAGLVGNSINMFTYCTSLRGGYGTAQFSGNYGPAYARIDAPDAPGYFTTWRAVAVYSSDARTLTFYADGNDHSDEGTVYPVLTAEIGSPTAYPPWQDRYRGATNIVFDASFATYRPRHCGSWFRGFENLISVNGVENLDLSAATSLEYMFAECTALTELDLSGLDTRNVKSIKNMFYKCENLETVEVGDNFSTAKLTDPNADVFGSCYKIVGRCGTTYDSLHISSEYARIDAPGAPGYFGRHTAVVVHSGNTLTFYFDQRDHSSEGTVYYLTDAEAINPVSENVPWYTACHGTVTDVVFDKSFSKYRPKQCGSWFYDFSALVRITDIKYLNVSEATNLKYMFCACTSLTRIDVSGFDTRKVKSIQNMFYGCHALETIEASKRFTTAALDNPDEQVFGNSMDALVGGRGTTYSSDNCFASYARIDERDKPGYFTGKRTAVAAYTKADATLTFYCDYADHSDADELYYMEDAEDCAGTVSDPMPWVKGCRLGVRRVVFDNSFSYYRPLRCTGWFRLFGNMERVYGLDNLDVSETLDLSGMFDRCYKVKELDFTRFDTHSVTSMNYIVFRCHNLETIYASEKFVTSALTDRSERIIYDCPKLVGGVGTVYDYEQSRWNYAHVDSYGNKGYFTSRNPVAVLSFDGRTLTFYADGAHHSAEGQAVYSVTNAENLSEWDMPPWHAASRTTVTSVVFDKSFRNYRPTSCAKWFQSLTQLTSISRISNLDVSHATSLNSMFYGCSALTTLGIESFDTERVMDMRYMFYGCTNLRTIYASDAFTTDRLSDTDNRMFVGCSSLVGGRGTEFSPGSTGSEYARIDKGSGAAGYLTKEREAVAVYADKTLTFYYDGLDHSSEGEVFSTASYFMYAVDNPKPWRTVLAQGINNVVFDVSFADFRPRDCAGWFKNCLALVSVTGLENLDVSKATSLEQMFYGCSALQTLDLSGFDTRSLKFSAREWDDEEGEHHAVLGDGCLYMFADCTSLRTIYATDDFSLPYAEEHFMFDRCYSLKGGNGTQYSWLGSSYAAVDSAYVRGYFTCLKPVAVYSDETKTLTFYYDGRNHSREGTVFSVARAEAAVGWVPGVGMVGMTPWNDVAEEVEKVVIDPSFADYRPSQCAYWFSNFTSCTDIAGLRYLDVSRATSLEEMFSGCEKLKTLDVTGFDTSNVRVMENMFACCTDLETIYATDSFTTRSLTGSQDLFELTAEHVVGGNGTTDEGYEATFARIDRPGEPGYFTEKVARAVYSLREKTLTFYYDTEAHPDIEDETVSWLVADVEAQDPSEMPPWNIRRERVVFDPSFAGYRPKHCGNWFKGASALTEIQGIQYLDVSAATSLRGMFQNCNRLTKLDLTGFNTSNVKDMRDMFSGCTNLVTIYASEGFTTEAVDSVGADRVMFENCYKLVGGDGTSYADVKNRYVDYARIDSLRLPGYFTEKSFVRLSGYEAWALDMGLTGDDAAWNAKPAMWGGKWENAFIYTYGERIIDGSRVLLDIYIDEAGEPVILTMPAIRGRNDFKSTVIGAPTLNDWTSPIILDQIQDDTWMLPRGGSANFFRLRLTNE